MYICYRSPKVIFYPFSLSLPCTPKSRRSFVLSPPNFRVRNLSLLVANLLSIFSLVKLDRLKTHWNFLFGILHLTHKVNLQYITSSSIAFLYNTIYTLSILMCYCISCFNGICLYTNFVSQYCCTLPCLYELLWQVYLCRSNRYFLTLF